MNLQRPALGDDAIIGTLYDARTDRFSPSSLWSDASSLPPDIISSADDAKVSINYGKDSSFQDRLALMNIKPDVAGSILANCIQPEGSGAYVLKDSPPPGFLHAAIAYTFTRAREKLRIQPQLASFVSKAYIQASNCTHFVAEVERGVATIISFTMASKSGSTREESQGLLDAEVARLKATADTLSTEQPAATDSLQEATLPLELTSFTDLSKGRIKIHGMREALNHLRIIPLQINQKLDGKGKPLSFSLLPLSMLNYLIPDIDLTSGLPVNYPVSNDYYLRIIDLFELYRSSYQRLRAFTAYAREHRDYLPSEYLQRIVEAEKELGKRGSTLKSSYSRHLLEVRSGDADISVLQQRILDRFARRRNPCLNIESLEADIPAKLSFIRAAVAQGAKYIGPYDSVNQALGDRDAYMISISDTAMKDRVTWDENARLFQNLLQAYEQNVRYLIRDCGQGLEKCVVGRYESGVEVVRNVCEEQRFHAEHSFARFRGVTLATDDLQLPAKRRQIRIACPGVDCDQAKTHDWMCSRCYAPIQFGYVDDYVYCDCGRTLYDSMEFRCKEITHGKDFQRYDNRRLLYLLKRLSESESLNILILGETGVGKSTFINAFINYLCYRDLDQAKEAKELISVIPCSFSVQTMDRARQNGKIEEIDIQVGSRDDELNGSRGASATQKTAVYSITIGSKMIRLIDTPGIGDTRGLEFDKRNMADILSTLSNYETLHGILILLKSNNSRLTVTFRFCVNELLTHLHRSAAQNMVFGFTNTRNANYTPGDTFKPLKTLLQEHEKNVGLSLTSTTTYCFDSESFRFLAAYKQNVIMDNEQEFSRSWDVSKQETQRLVEHFRSLPPHHVSNTLSLNGARQIITILTKPMADITSVINTNIAVCDDKLRALFDTRIHGHELRLRLRTQKIELHYKQLERPRTVCAHTNCVEYRDDGSGKNVKTTVYKTVCHKDCSQSVLINTRGDSQLLQCCVFMGKDACSVCGHGWREHLHVLTEHEERLVEVDDPEIQRQLDGNASNIELRETARKKQQKLIEEYQQEHKEIQNASAKFGIFLKMHSITPYNDATVEYLDMLIKEEKGKVECAGGNSQRLESLEKDRSRHLELVEVLTKNMNKQSRPESSLLEPAGIKRLVRELYSLKHFGENLEDVKNTIVAVHEATNRERAFRVGASFRRPLAGSSQDNRRGQKSTRKKPSTSTHPLIALLRR